MTCKVITEISQTRSAPNLTTVAGGQAVEEGALTQSTAVVADVAQVVLGLDFVDTLVRVQIVGAAAAAARKLVEGARLAAEGSLVVAS